MVMKAVFAISIITLLLLSSTLTVNGAFASKSQPEKDTHQDEINGPGGLMSLSGPPTQATNPSNPLQIKEHHPAHVKKFIGPSVSLSGGDAPVMIWTAYGFNSLGCTHTTKTDWTDPSLCGHGQTIAIVDAYDDPNIVSDLQTFDGQFGLPACPANSCFVKLEQGTPSTDSGWALEISLDVEWAHSIAPGAKIVLVESSDNSLGNLLTGVDTAVGQGAQQVSNSWGSSEFSTESNYDYHYNSPTASFFVSSGDSGHGVTWPAASPYVISVGGTTLVTDSSGHWLSETAWSGSGGGISAYESKQSYQNNFNPNSKRAVPDVAYDANPNTGVYVYDSVPINGNSGWWIVGGTSAGAPQWAGISAITNSQNAKLASSASFGTSNALYGAASGAESNPQTNPYLTNYHDITTGSNGNCGSICTVALGYDFVTGLGSPLTNNLISYLHPSPPPDFAISSSPSSLTVNSGSSGSSTITVTSINGFTGTVSLAASSILGTSLNPTSISGGAGTSQLSITVPANTASGTYTVTVTSTSNTLSHSTTVTVTVVATIPVDYNSDSLPVGIAYDSGKGEIFVTNSGNGIVYVISDATNTIIKTVTVGSGPVGIAYDSAKGEMFVANISDNTVSVIRDSDNAVIATIPVINGPYGVAYDSGMHEIFVTNFSYNTVSIISDASNTVVATVTTATTPYGIAYDSAKNEVFVSNFNNNTVSVIRDSDNTVVSTISVGSNPNGVAYDPIKGKIFVTNVFDDTVSVISDTSNTVVATVKVGASPQCIAYDSAKGDMMVSNFNNNTVSVISDSSNTVVATISDGTNPWGIAYDSGKGEIFVTNFSDNTVSVISDATIQLLQQ
jgi:YVTN family beta-propeller protein